MPPPFNFGLLARRRRNPRNSDGFRADGTGGASYERLKELVIRRVGECHSLRCAASGDVGRALLRGTLGSLPPRITDVRETHTRAVGHAAQRDARWLGFRRR